MPINVSTINYPHMATHLANISEAITMRDQLRDSIIDIAALAITFALMTGFIILVVYAWRNRCDGRQNVCAACRLRQLSILSGRDDDLEDVGFF